MAVKRLKLETEWAPELLRTLAEKKLTEGQGSSLALRAGKTRLLPYSRVHALDAGFRGRGKAALDMLYAYGAALMDLPRPVRSVKAFPMMDAFRQVLPGARWFDDAGRGKKVAT